MGHLAKADGRVTEQEIQMAKVLMSEMKLSREQQNRAKKLFSEGKHNNFKLEPILIRLKQQCGNNRELLKLFVETQYRAAQVDGLTLNKIQVLNIIFSHLGFAPLHKQYRFYEDFSYTAYHNFQENQKQQSQNTNNQSSSSSYQRYQPKSSVNNLDHAYALIEVSPSASKQEVKKAYRRLLSRNHPDKLIAKGLPEETIKIANEKTQKIMKAYELICKSKGW